MRAASKEISIIEESEDEFFDTLNATLDKEQEEMPWIEKVADDRAYKKVMSEVLERYQVLGDRELEQRNRMMQHRRKCKAQRRD